MIVKIGNTEADIRVTGVLSLPRLSFSANVFTWVQALMPLRIMPMMGMGCFWGQSLERVMEDLLNDNEFLLVMDYDSFFTQQDVEELFALTIAFGCDALTGLQTKREDGRPMLTLKGTQGQKTDGKSSLPKSWFGQPVQEVDAIHFGCTIISTAALKRTKKPWFWSSPNEDGQWRDGRTDEDMYFWKNFRESGNRVYVTPRIALGHGEYVVTWPNRDLSGPVFQWTTAFNEKQQKPDAAWRVSE